MGSTFAWILRTDLARLASHWPCLSEPVQSRSQIPNFGIHFCLRRVRDAKLLNTGTLGLRMQKVPVRELTGTFLLLRGQDLNLRPLGYEPSELPNCSTPRHKN